jgi:hypothetical protein
VVAHEWKSLPFSLIYIINEFSNEKYKTKYARAFNISNARRSKRFENILKSPHYVYSRVCATSEEIYQTVLLSLNTLGFPKMIMTYSLVKELIDRMRTE